MDTDASTFILPPYSLRADSTGIADNAPRSVGSARFERPAPDQSQGNTRGPGSCLASGGAPAQALASTPTSAPPADASRRSALIAAAGVLLAPCASAITFSPGDTADSGDLSPNQVRPGTSRGQMPSDFWYRPRSLWLENQNTRQYVKATYWRDGRIDEAGYWQICALLKDHHQNVMTAMDPAVLDVLRGIHGYYESWNWNQPIVVTSGFRTQQTNRSLAKEGAARNSMHLYGKAVDLYIRGIPSRDIAALGIYLEQGGVGFYPDKHFTHLDTGKIRAWRG